MVRCTRCGHVFAPAKDLRSETAFELFHVYRDAYAHAQGYDNIYAKDELCVLYGTAYPVDEMDFTDLPGWEGRFCYVWDRWYYRKSTRNYTREEMAKLIDMTANAIVEAGGEVPA